ncbi:hypothetical protein [Tepidanaerobacter acetatoxydans]|uniref:hypothetical protein n=1 Tax=Tepidanaerobacter acetatoxydans TaxID=499229 RepID=UPI001BD25EA1|nr:hypothetical protein [Tepidanaerobacter acetatoxydans]
MLNNGRILGLYTPHAVDEIRHRDYKHFSNNIEQAIKNEQKKIQEEIADLQRTIDKLISNNSKDYSTYICYPFTIERCGTEILVMESKFDINKIGDIYVYTIRNNKIGELYFDEKSEGKIYIVDIVLNGCYQRYGIASKMVKLMEDTIKPYGYKRVIGWLSPVDAPRRNEIENFWQKNGYKIKADYIYKDLDKNPYIIGHK